MKIVNLLFILNQLRIFHWQTTSYAEHQAFGLTYDSLDETIDKFVEVYMGKHGRVFQMGDNFNVQLYNYSSENLNQYIEKTIDYLTYNLLPSSEYEPVKNTDLLNIRDEMLGDINKLKYLLTLK